MNPLFRSATLSALAIFCAVPAWAFCGPGPVVTMNSKSIIVQSLGATINATFLPTQALAITSGTSGCTNSGLVLEEQEREEFVAHNIDNLAHDMAQGRGPYLETMAVLMGCRAETHGEFARFAQQSYARLFSEADTRPATLLARLRQHMARHAVLSGGCPGLSQPRILL